MTGSNRVADGWDPSGSLCAVDWGMRRILISAKELGAGRTAVGWGVNKEVAELVAGGFG